MTWDGLLGLTLAQLQEEQPDLLRTAELEFCGADADHADLGDPANWRVVRAIQSGGVWRLTLVRPPILGGCSKAAQSSEENDHVT